MLILRLLSSSPASPTLPVNHVPLEPSPSHAMPPEIGRRRPASRLGAQRGLTDVRLAPNIAPKMAYVRLGG